MIKYNREICETIGQFIFLRIWFHLFQCQRLKTSSVSEACSRLHNVCWLSDYLIYIVCVLSWSQWKEPAYDREFRIFSQIYRPMFWNWPIYLGEITKFVWFANHNRHTATCLFQSRIKRTGSWKHSITTIHKVLFYTFSHKHIWWADNKQSIWIRPDSQIELCSKQLIYTNQIFHLCIPSPGLLKYLLKNSTVMIGEWKTFLFCIKKYYNYF